MSVPHSFSEKMRDGDLVANHLAEHLRSEHGWVVKACDGELFPLQALGIDYICEKPTGARLSLEVKADYRAVHTGNFFIETMSVVEAGKLGWVHTCTAQFLAIVQPQSGDVYIFESPRLRRLVASWEETPPPAWYRRPHRTTHGGRAWTTRGLAIPIPVLADQAHSVFNIGPLQAGEE